MKANLTQKVLAALCLFRGVFGRWDSGPCGFQSSTVVQTAHSPRAVTFNITGRVTDIHNK